MKKLTAIILAVVGLYFLSVFTRAELAERKAEKHMAFLLPEISSPWSAERIRLHCSEWLCKRANLTPEDISRLATEDLGALKEITGGPKCKFQSGHERGREEEKLTWAMCDVTARFEKKTARLKIRLVEEPRQPVRLFGIPGESLRINDFANIEIVR